jgi:lipopolysaccharide biosynthesis glycosyltransferase
LTPYSIPVILNFDKAYLLPATVTIFSLLKNHPGREFKIYLIIAESNPIWMKPLTDMVKKMGSEVIVKSVNLGLLSDVKLNKHFTLATYFRLFAANLIEEPKALYLDSDILINGDLTELWETDLGDYPIAAVEDFMIDDFHRLDLSSDTGYFNSGVMVLQLNEWRKLDLGSTTMDYITEFPEKIIYADQCGLNAVLQGNWYHLPPKWNYQSHEIQDSEFILNKSYFSKNHWNEALNQPKIIHFTGLPKPWNLGGNHPYKSLYWHYLRQSPLSRKLPLNFTLTNLLKANVPLQMKKLYWRYLSNRKVNSKV